MHTESRKWGVVAFLYVMMAIPAIPAAVIIALVAMGADASDRVPGFVNALHYQQPLAVFVHGGAGIVFFLTMPLQFVPALRAHSWHRLSGRVVLLSGYVMAVSAIWMHLVLTPEETGARLVSLVVMSVALCLAFTIALAHILGGNVLRHRMWMIRAVAISLAAITPLFIEGVAVLLLSQWQSVFLWTELLLHDYGRLFAIAINLFVVESMMSRQRRSVERALTPAPSESI